MVSTVETMGPRHGPRFPAPTNVAPVTINPASSPAYRLLRPASLDKGRCGRGADTGRSGTAAIVAKSSAADEYDLVGDQLRAA